MCICNKVHLLAAAASAAACILSCCNSFLSECSAWRASQFGSTPRHMLLIARMGSQGIGCYLGQICHVNKWHKPCVVLLTVMLLGHFDCIVLHSHLSQSGHALVNGVATRQQEAPFDLIAGLLPQARPHHSSCLATRQMLSFCQVLG